MAFLAAEVSARYARRTVAAPVSAPERRWRHKEALRPRTYF
jgi:hypothetical protein